MHWPTDILSLTSNTLLFVAVIHTQRLSYSCLRLMRFTPDIADRRSLPEITLWGNRRPRSRVSRSPEFLTAVDFLDRKDLQASGWISSFTPWSQINFSAGEKLTRRPCYQSVCLWLFPCVSSHARDETSSRTIPRVPSIKTIRNLLPFPIKRVCISNTNMDCHG